MMVLPPLSNMWCVARKLTIYPFFLWGPHIEIAKDSCGESKQKNHHSSPISSCTLEFIFLGWYFKTSVEKQCQAAYKNGDPKPNLFLRQNFHLEKNPNIENPNKTWVFRSWAPRTMKKNRRKSGP